MIGKGDGRCASGYLTVYLALVMAVILSLCLALIEGVRSNAIRVEAECVTAIGLNSILAEYHRELFAQYNLFAVDSSYGTVAAGVEDMEEHLTFYINRNISSEDIFLANYWYRDFLKMSVESVAIRGASIMTDEGGAVFRRRAAEAIRDDCNLTLLQELLQWGQVIEDNGLRDRNVAEEKSEIDKQLMHIYENNQGEESSKYPTAELDQIRSKGILGYVVKDADALSQKSLATDGLIGERMKQGLVNQGNLAVGELSDAEKMWERFCFQEYLLKYMGRYGEEKEGSALSYQIEYVLAGQSADIANVKQIVNIICAVREAANALYLFSDEEKCKEAEMVATLLATLLQVPQAASLIKAVILLGWAFAESLYDVKMLLSGESIPLIKTKESWHYGLESALSIGSEEQESTSEGLSYEDYLRVLMFFADLETLSARAMNMVEADIRLTVGNCDFRLDNCYDRIECCVQINSEYGYEYEITSVQSY